MKNFPGRENEFASAFAAFKAGKKLLQKDEVDFNAAREQFDIAFRFNPRHAELCFYSGICALECGDPSGALTFFRAARDLDQGKLQSLLFYLGRSFHASAQWDSAGVAYARYLRSLEDTTSETYRMTLTRMRECELGNALNNQKSPWKVSNLGEQINSKYEDYTPFVLPDESILFFTSRRSGQDEEILKSAGTRQQRNEDIYKSSFQEGQWSMAVNAGGKVNTRLHNAVCGVHPDGTSVLIFRGDVKGGDLFIVSYRQGEWGELRSLGPEINSVYHESSACFADDGKSLFFVSDRPGGRGGRDIYFSQFIDSTSSWGPAVNLGATVNSAQDEEGVFYHTASSTLYFASNGWSSVGGYDIQKSVRVNGQWTSPVNMGLPFNSPADEVFVSCPGNANHFYFSSNRAGGMGGKDIYMASADDTTAIDSVQLTLPETDSSSAMIPEASLQDAVSVSFEGGAGQGANTEEQMASVAGADAHTVSFNQKNTSPTSANGTVNDVVQVRFESNYYFEESVKEGDDLIYAQQDLRSAYHLQSLPGDEVSRFVFYTAEGSLTLSDSSMQLLEHAVSFLQRYPDLMIIIYGHTDRSGDADRNLLLSEKRARTVFYELIRRGIDRNRLQYVGMGEWYPMHAETGPESARMNRRIELRRNVR